MNTHGPACPTPRVHRRTNPRDVIKPYATDSLSQTRPRPIDCSAERELRADAVRSGCLDVIPQTWPDENPCSRIADDGIARGIHFFCVNANVWSQFGSLQQTWCNNPRFRRPPTTTRIRFSVTTPGPNQTSSRMTIPRQPSPVQTAALRARRACEGRRVPLHAQHHGPAFSRRD